MQIYIYLPCSFLFFFFNLNSLLTILKLGRSSYKKKKRKEISPQLSKNIENNSRFSSSNLRGRDSTVCWCPVSQSPLSFLLLFFLSTSLGPRPAGTFFFFLIIFYYFLAPSSGMQGLPLSTRGQTHAPWSWSTESWPMDCQGSSPQFAEPSTVRGK